MTQVDMSATPLGQVNGLHAARDPDLSGFSEVSFASTMTEDPEAELLAPRSSAKASSSTYAEPDYSFDTASSSIRPITTSNLSHKAKQPSNGLTVDADHQKLSPIDETSAAGSSSHKYADAYNSSANGYLQHSTPHLYQERGQLDSPDLDSAYSPSTYPPTSEEDSEAKRVQNNLERWANEERQRRKAQRTSKIAANRVSTGPGGGGGLAHRFSMLRPAGSSTKTNNLGSGPSSERLADEAASSPKAPYNSNRDSTTRREGVASLTVGATRGRSASSSSLDSAQSLGSLTSDEHRPNRKLPPIGSRVSSTTHTKESSRESEGSTQGLGLRANGSAHDPFRDPSDAIATTDSYPKRSSLKPTPTASRPIVTVGRASSIQRQALEASYKNSKGKGKERSMPTIVATDTEAEDTEDISYGSDAAGSNPFASTQDSRSGTTTTTIHQGGLDEEVTMEFDGRREVRPDANGDLGESGMDTWNRPAQSRARSSTSSSKFRELGISQEDDWIETVGRSMKNSARKMRVARQAESDDEADERRKPWWTELLCGCSRDKDDDEQAGRTNPME
ncbi:hypothetical protein PSEUBRA_000889 [Kalmanozyma brasiliensis GHG001]|uniref:uncharacterized protein n=1 Tax=Kalmanozyma brasiliensis (strain GHG001) TaxID=1365824 RepID=UPI001CE953DF|nr:uncharacterized protein PSEUBRA_000889 [Kalmanozyma brasiliensis GHG001]KAF6766859.1 hypothetical protein PSEUBRA_000889 [Kalmanozyma brasiliensis GHG001]